MGRLVSRAHSLPRRASLRGRAHAALEPHGAGRPGPARRSRGPGSPAAFSTFFPLLSHRDVPCQSLHPSPGRARGPAWLCAEWHPPVPGKFGVGVEFLLPRGAELGPQPCSERPRHSHTEHPRPRRELILPRAAWGWGLHPPPPALRAASLTSCRFLPWLPAPDSFEERGGAASNLTLLGARPAPARGHLRCPVSPPGTPEASAPRHRVLAKAAVTTCGPKEGAQTEGALGACS